MRLFQRDEEVCMAIMVLFLALVWVWPIYRNEVSSNPSWHFLASTRRLIWINSKESNLSFVPLEKTSMRCKMVVMETKENGGLYYNLFNPVQPFFPQGSHGKCKSTGP